MAVLRRNSKVALLHDFSIFRFSEGTPREYGFVAGEYVWSIVEEVLATKEKLDSLELAEGMGRLEGVVSLDLNYSKGEFWVRGKPIWISLVLFCFVQTESARSCTKTRSWYWP